MFDFLETNYIWIIVAGVIILMAIIGYFAEKSGNHNKTKQKNNKREEEFESEVEEPLTNEFIETEEKAMEDSIYDEEKKEDIYSDVVNSSNDCLEIAEENSFGPFEENLYSDFNEDVEPQMEVSVEPQTELSFEPQEELSFEPLSDEKNDSLDREEPVIENQNNFAYENESINTSYDEPEKKIYADEPIAEIDKETEMSLPSIETLNEEIKDVVDEDDVWKF